MTNKYTHKRHVTRHHAPSKPATDTAKMNTPRRMIGHCRKRTHTVLCCFASQIPTPTTGIDNTSVTKFNTPVKILLQPISDRRKQQTVWVFLELFLLSSLLQDSHRLRLSWAAPFFSFFSPSLRRQGLFLSFFLCKTASFLGCFLFCSSSSSSCADHSPLKIPAAALRDWILLVRNLLPRARNFQMRIKKCRKMFCDLRLLSSRLFSSRDSTISLRSSLDCRCNGQLSATPLRSSRLATARNGRRRSSRAGAGPGRVQNSNRGGGGGCFSSGDSSIKYI